MRLYLCIPFPSTEIDYRLDMMTWLELSRNHKSSEPIMTLTWNKWYTDYLQDTHVISNDFESLTVQLNSRDRINQNKFVVSYPKREDSYKSVACFRFIAHSQCTDHEAAQHKSVVKSMYKQ